MNYRLLLICLLAVSTTFCGGGKSTPTSPTPPTSNPNPTPAPAPTPTPTPTPAPPPATHTVAGVLRDATTQAAVGGGTVRVQSGTGLNNQSGTDGNGYYSIPGVSGAIVLAFSAPNYDPRSQTVNVNGDTRFDFALTRTAPPWSQRGVGNNAFTMPSNVSRVRIVGIYNSSSSNFVVRIGGRLIVNELLGTFWGPTRYDGVHLTGGGGTVEITLSAGVSWEFTAQ